MRTLRPINLKIGNLRGYIASKVRISGNSLTIQFDPVAGGQGKFCVQLEEVLEVIDRGLVFQPLTAGIIWKPVGEFGRAAAFRLGQQNVADLIEVRLDHEDSEGLHCRFQAVARAAKIWEGSLRNRL